MLIRYWIAGALLAAGGLDARAQSVAKIKETDSLFLDMSKLNLGTITSEEDKKKYIYTIQLEKARITRKTLKGVYENAFDLYQKGEYDAARDLTAKIISIDPSYSDASILQRASIELRGSKRPRFSEKKLVEDKFEEGMALYRQGRLVEATGRWEESSKLSPGNLKTHYWLNKARGELADDHYRRGQKAYRQHRFREALDQWYAALVLNPRYSKINAAIAKVEAEAREQESNEKLQTALNLYSQGETAASLKMLDSVLESGPGNVKAQKLTAEIRSEMASQHVAQGRQLYEKRKYKEAIAEWKQAVAYGFDPRSADQFAARAKEQMRREELSRKQAIELAKEDAEKRKKEAEEAKLQAEEDAKKKKEEAQTVSTKTDSPVSASAAPSGVISEESRRSSQQHYLSGVVYFQKGDYNKAHDEWSLAKQLDPGNSDAQAGLDRIDKLYGGGQ